MSSSSQSSSPSVATLVNLTTLLTSSSGEEGSSSTPNSSSSNPTVSSATTTTTPSSIVPHANWDKSMGMSVASVLTDCIRNTKASTVNEVMVELERTIQKLMNTPGLDKYVALQSTCDLYKRFIARVALDDIQEFEEVKRQLLKRAETFTLKCSSCRQLIAERLKPFLQHDTTILINSYSRMVAYAIIHAVKKRRRLKLLVTESLPDRSGVEFIQAIMTAMRSQHVASSTTLRKKHSISTSSSSSSTTPAAAAIPKGSSLLAPTATTGCGRSSPSRTSATVEGGVPAEDSPESYSRSTHHQDLCDNLSITLIRDSAAASLLSTVDFVLFGAEGVVESGGIINKIGTYGLALAAKSLGKPVYVAVESYKFLRQYPLAQSDIAQPRSQKDTALLDGVPSGIRICSRYSDYTPPEYITLLFTDLGILTPSAVSDELIKLYHEPLLML